MELGKEVAITQFCSLRRCFGASAHASINSVDSPPLRICKNQRIHIHKTLKGIAQIRKCSMGWFFVFKLHLICNEHGELLNFMITPGDIDDRKPLEKVFC